MRTRTLIKDLAAREDGPVTLGGWVEKLRDQKRIQFIILRDETGSAQITYPRPTIDDAPDENDALAAKVSTLTNGSFTSAFIHAYYGKKGAIDVVIQDLAEMEMVDDPYQRAKIIRADAIYGIFTFADGKPQFLDVLLQS